MNRPFAYVCAPTAGETGNNNKKVRGYCRKLYELGYLPVAPHLLFPQFVNNNVPSEHNDCIHMASDMLRRCRVVVVCGKTNSEVMTNEIELAKRLGNSTLLRKLIMGTEIKERPNVDFIDLRQSIDHIGININQIAHWANANGGITPEQFEEARKLLAEVKWTMKGWAKKWL